MIQYSIHWQSILPDFVHSHTSIERESIHTVSDQIYDIIEIVYRKEKTIGFSGFLIEIRYM